MTEDISSKEGSGIIGRIRSMSRRLSATFLDTKQPGLPLIGRDRKPIYTYDDKGQLTVGGVPVAEIAETYGTPVYLYDCNRLVSNYEDYFTSLRNFKNFQVCYAIKANSSLAILDIFHKLGAGFDVVSGGEIARCLAAGVEPSAILFSGCGKSHDEIAYAVKNDIFCFNIDSWGELERVEEIARTHNHVQNVAIRINPEVNIDGSTNNKFGVPISDANEIYSRAKASAFLKIKGISCHIGSGLSQVVEPFIEARDKLLTLADELRRENRIWVEHINLSGGFAAPGAIAGQILVPDIPGWVERLCKPITDRGLKVILEPGRSLVADAGILLTKVEYVKKTPSPSSGTTSPRSGSVVGVFGTSPKAEGSAKSNQPSKNLLVVNAGFNDFARTVLYGAQHKIIPAHVTSNDPAAIEYKYDVVGPIAESTDTFAKDLVLSEKIESGNLLAICDTGAYGMSMTVNYSSRNRASEVIIADSVDGSGRSAPYLIRERETYEEQFKREKLVAGLKLRTLTIDEDENEEKVSANGEAKE